MRVCVCVSVCDYFPCLYPNNANPSIFSTVNKLRYVLCLHVFVYVCALYSAKCLPSEALAESLDLSTVYLEGITSAN